MNTYEIAKQIMLDCGVTILRDDGHSLWVVNKHGLKDIILNDEKHIMAYVHGYELD